MKGLIDPKAEIARVSKLIANNESDIGKLSAKLANTRYAEHAKPELVAADRARLGELTDQTASYKVLLEKVYKLEGSS